MKLKTYLFGIVIIIFVISCDKSHEEININTATGPISSLQLGTTLIHEHILVDFIGADKTGFHRWDKIQVIDKVLPYLMEIKKLGVKTLFECTPAYLGRDVQILKTLSDKSGINIVTNTGFYGAVNDKYIPSFAFEVGSDSLAAIWINEFNEGIEGTAIKPGFIKISVDTNDVLSEIDKKIVEAAILTHRKTGLTIVSHTTADQPAFEQLKLLVKMGVSPNAWVWTHAGECTSEGRIKAANMGAWISIDNINQDALESNIRILTELKTEGYLKQTLISHDAGWYDPDQLDGGEFRGFTDIFTHLIPILKREGFSEEDLNQLLILNPRNAYMPKIRKN